MRLFTEYWIFYRTSVYTRLCGSRRDSYFKSDCLSALSKTEEIAFLDDPTTICDTSFTHTLAVKP
jgi:hypothetical protein